MIVDIVDLLLLGIVVVDVVGACAAGLVLLLLEVDGSGLGVEKLGESVERIWFVGDDVVEACDKDGAVIKAKTEINTYDVISIILLIPQRFLFVDLLGMSWCSYR